MKLRDYQSEAVDFLAARKRGFIVAPAGSGKTIIGAAALARVVKPGQKIIWLANTLEQVEQAGAALALFPGPECDLTVCCVAAQPDTTGADIIVMDEAHHAAAETWYATVVGATCTIWGLSATPWHPDEERNVIVRLVFEEFHTIERDRVLASGHLVEGKAFLHDLDRPGEFDADINARTVIETNLRCRRFWSIPRFEHERRAKWQITQETIQQNENRNQAAIGLAKKEIADGQSVLLLVSSIEHGEKFAQAIPRSALCHSKIGKKKRANLIASFRVGELACLVATSLADEGLDVPVASRLILVAGGRSATKVEQRAGRVLRPFAGKTGGAIHDFLDRGATFAHAQAKARMRTYEALGYDPEIVRY